MKRLRLRFVDTDGNQGIVRFWIQDSQHLDDTVVSSIASIFTGISDATLLEVSEIAEKRYHPDTPTSGSRIQTGCAILALTTDDVVYTLVIPAAKEDIFSNAPETYGIVIDSALVAIIKNAFNNTPIVDVNGVSIDTDTLIAFKVS